MGSSLFFEYLFWTQKFFVCGFKKHFFASRVGGIDFYTLGLGGGSGKTMTQRMALVEFFVTRNEFEMEAMEHQQRTTSEVSVFTTRVF